VQPRKDGFPALRSGRRRGVGRALGARAKGPRLRRGTREFILASVRSGRRSARLEHRLLREQGAPERGDRDPGSPCPGQSHSGQHGAPAAFRPWCLSPVSAALTPARSLARRVCSGRSRLRTGGDHVEKGAAPAGNQGLEAPDVAARSPQSQDRDRVADDVPACDGALHGASRCMLGAAFRYRRRSRPTPWAIDTLKGWMVGDQGFPSWTWTLGSAMSFHE